MIFNDNGKLYPIGGTTELGRGTVTPFKVTARFGTARPVWPAVLRGLRGRCPACGQGRLFGRFLKPVEHCHVCKESYVAQRADDFPPYLVVLLLGHILVPTVITIDKAFTPPLWIYTTFGSALVAVLAVALLQPVKGAVIAYQWAYQIDGFGISD